MTSIVFFAIHYGNGRYSDGLMTRQLDTNLKYHVWGGWEQKDIGAIG